jgi:HEAT repeat protein
MALALATLGQVGAQSVADYLVERIADSGIEPYWFARTLRCVPRSLVADESVAGIFEDYCRDIEDSLTVVPPDPVRREVLQEGLEPPSRSTEELLRDLLHRRDLVLRKRALEALGILAHARPHEVATSLARWDDLSDKPAYESLTGEEGRLSALWAIGETEPAAVVRHAGDIYERYVEPGGACRDHFTLHELGRRVCLCALGAAPNLFPEQIAKALRQANLPRRFETWPDRWGCGREASRAFQAAS